MFFINYFFFLISGENPSKDLVHVLAINPLRLFTASRISGKVNILNLEAYLPRLNVNGRYKFTITPLFGKYSDCVILHENNVRISSPSN